MCSGFDGRGFDGRAETNTHPRRSARTEGCKATMAKRLLSRISAIKSAKFEVHMDSKFDLDRSALMEKRVLLTCLLNLWHNPNLRQCGSKIQPEEATSCTYRICTPKPLRLPIKGHVPLGLFIYIEYVSIPDCALPTYTPILPRLWKTKGWNCCAYSMKLSWTATLLCSIHLLVITGVALGLRPIITSAEFSLDRLRAPNVTSIANNRPHCTRSLKWTGSPYLPERCVEALNSLYRDYVLALNTTEFGFIAPGAVPTFEPLVPVTTPKKWEIGKLFFTWIG